MKLENKRRAVAGAALLALAGCGGGGGGNGGGDHGQAGLISWNGSVNGSTVKDADNDSLAFRTDGVMVRGDTSYPGVKVADGGRLTWSGAVIGSVTLADATGGGKLAVLRCTDGRPLNLTFLSDRVDYNCVSNSTTSGGIVTAPRYVRWTGNTLEHLVKDADEDWYAVLDSGNRELAFLGSRNAGPVLEKTPVVYTNSRVDSSARVFIDGVAVGTASRVTSTSGSSIVALRCNDGSAMAVRGHDNDGSRAQAICGSTGSNGGSSGSTGSVTSTYSFIRYNGSANGICIIDASDDCFAFDSKTGLLSFLGAVREVDVNGTDAQPAATYANSKVVYSVTAVDALSVAGTIQARVRRVRLANGATGAAFVCDDGNYADLYPDPARRGDALIRCTNQPASLV